MAAWRRLPSPARGGLIAAVSAVFGAAAAILVSASGLVDSQIPSIGAPSTVTVTAAPQASDPAAGLEPVPPAPKDRFGDSPEGRGFNVGTDVLAGTYSTKAPRTGESCIWQRLRADAGGALVRVADGRRENGSATVALRIGDVIVTSGCQDWVRKP
jgi:hypothetical protein